MKTAESQTKRSLPGNNSVQANVLVAITRLYAFTLPMPEPKSQPGCCR